MAIENQLLLLTVSNGRQQEQVEVLQRDLQRVQNRYLAIEKIPLIREQTPKKQVIPRERLPFRPPSVYPGDGPSSTTTAPCSAGSAPH